MNRKESIELLNSFSNLFSQMTDNEYDLFLKGELDFKFSPKKSSTNTTSSQADIIPIYDDIKKSLDSINDRLTARNFLFDSSYLKTRDSIEKFAKHLNIHVSKSDKKEEIIDKIVESVVGVKLRSEAIKAVNLGGGQYNNLQ